MMENKIYHIDRAFQVHLGTIMSNKIFHHGEGVPQCAILSTTLLYPLQNKVLGGVYWFHPVRPSVRPSVRL